MDRSKCWGFITNWKIVKTCKIVRYCIYIEIIMICEILCNLTPWSNNCWGNLNLRQVIGRNKSGNHISNEIEYLWMRMFERPPSEKHCTAAALIDIFRRELVPPPWSIHGNRRKCKLSFSDDHSPRIFKCRLLRRKQTQVEHTQKQAQVEHTQKTDAGWASAMTTHPSPPQRQNIGISHHAPPKPDYELMDFSKS